MITTRELAARILVWLKLPVVLGLEDAQAIHANPRGPTTSPRPAPPYLTVLVMPSETLGEDWIESAPTAATAGTQAARDFGVVAPGTFDTTIEAVTAGVSGNNYTIVLVPDSASGVDIQIVGYAVLIHYEAGVSTVLDVENAIDALSGDDDVIDVGTAGTAATVLEAVDAVESTLTGGTDGVGAFLTVRGEREATVSIQGFGELTAEWLERLTLRAYLPAVIAEATSRGFAFRDQGPLRDLSALLDTSAQPRFVREFTVGYQVAETPEDAVAYATTTTTIEYTDRDPDPDPLIDEVVTP